MLASYGKEEEEEEEVDRSPSTLHAVEAEKKSPLGLDVVKGMPLF